jgi:hypothetical protein
MLVYRSFVIGLLGACCLLLAQRQRLEIRMLPAAPPAPAAVEHATIVDISAQVTPEQLAALLHVHVGARVDVTGPDWSYSTSWLASNGELAGAFAVHIPPRGGFLDISVDGHRTLVLAH